MQSEHFDLNEIQNEPSPTINARRVERRVMKRGHNIPISKIIARYTRSLANCSVTARIADRAYAYDNSVENASAQLVFRTSEKKLIKHYHSINLWALEILLEIDQESIARDGIQYD